MRRLGVAMAIVGLIGITALAGRAQQINLFGQKYLKAVTLFGQGYTLERHSLGGKYKNGLSVTQPAEDDKTTTVRFVQGDTPDKDRLYAGCAFRGPEGCSLGAADRPNLCVRYVCRELDAELASSSEGARIKSLARRIGDTFVRFRAAHSGSPT